MSILRLWSSAFWRSGSYIQDFNSTAAVIFNSFYLVFISYISVEFSYPPIICYMLNSRRPRHKLTRLPVEGGVGAKSPYLISLFPFPEFKHNNLLTFPSL